MYQKKNFAKSTLSAQLLIAGTSLSVKASDGSKFPDTGEANVFMGVIWGSAYSTPESDPDREIVKAYRSSGDAFTIVRAQESTSAKQWEDGDSFMLTVTAGVYDEIDEFRIPSGGGIEWYSDTIPSAFLLMDGSEVSRDTYARLFNAIGTQYGVGDGTDTFNLPNRAGKVGIGKDAGDVDFDTLGETGGAKTMTLTTSHMPAHYHTVNPPNTTSSSSGNHKHTIQTFAGGVNTNGGGTQRGYDSGTGSVYVNATNYAGTHYHTVDIAQFNSGSVGSGLAFSIMNPFIIINFIIKT